MNVKILKEGGTVVRGKDWCYKDQDRYKGNDPNNLYIGTIVRAHTGDSMKHKYTVGWSFGDDYHFYEYSSIKQHIKPYIEFVQGEMEL